MKRSSLVVLLSSAWIAAGCGSRTSGDDLLGYNVVGAGGRTLPGSGGDTATGGAIGSGGVFGTGGLVGTGGSGGIIIGNDCCTARDSAGCEVTLVEECVCAGDPWCCDQNWDETCVLEAGANCFAGCIDGTGGVGAGGTGGVATGGAGGTGGSGGVQNGDCCEATFGKGCSVPSVRACVCQGDPYCCDVAWDQQCVNESSLCGTDCSAGGTGGQMGTGGFVGTGGQMGTGGSAGGTGGQMATGGTGGQMGTGGSSWNCDQAFPGACGSCLCDGCYSELDSCRRDVGCFAILWCIETSGCQGFGCYQQGTCREIIDSFGGISGPSSTSALSLYACTTFSGCPCN